MVIRRKKLRSNTGRISFKRGLASVGRKRAADRQNSGFGVFFKAAALVFVFGAIGVGFVYLDKYVKKVAPTWGSTIEVELVEPPAWINESLRERIIAAATGLWRGEEGKIQGETARLI